MPDSRDVRLRSRSPSSCRSPTSSRPLEISSSRSLGAPTALEIQDGGYRSGEEDPVNTQGSKEKSHCCFPLSLCGPCEAVPGVKLLCGWVPNTLKVIQDWTHLTCSLGMFSQIALFVVSIVNFATLQVGIFTLQYFFAVREFLAIILVISIFPYCMSVIGRYDGRLMDKKEEQRRQKEKLQKEYDHLFTDMNSRIEAFAEYSAGFATNIFENKMRSLSHWATQVGTGLERDTEYMSRQEADELKDEYISMLMNFAHVIQECGIDPVDHPVILFKREELECLTNFKDIADLVKQRCGTSKSAIEFETSSSRKINGWSEHKKGECGSCKKVYSVSQARAAKGKCTVCSGKTMFFPVYLTEVPAWDISKPGQCDGCQEWFSPEQALHNNGVCPSCRPEVDLHEVTQLNAVIKKIEADNRTSKRIAGGLLGRNPSLMPGRAEAATGKRCTNCCPLHITCGGCQCGREWNKNEKDGWPCKVGCMCVSMKVFSKDHVKLMVGFLMCLALCGCNAAWIFERLGQAPKDSSMNGEKSGFALWILALFFIMLNVLVMLARFEDLDIVQQLCREIQVLKDENVKVENTREEVQNTYGKFQDMNEIWLNRTIPRLELVSRTALMLQNMDSKSSVQHWMFANRAIQEVESKIGALEDWVGTDKVTADDKKAFRKNIEHTYSEDDVLVVTDRLKYLVGGGGLRKLEALTPNKKDRPWHPGRQDSVYGEIEWSPPVPRISEVPMYEP